LPAGSEPVFFERLSKWLLDCQRTTGRAAGFLPNATFPMLRFKPFPEITGYGCSVLSKLYKMTGRPIYLARARMAADALIHLMSSQGAINAKFSSREFRIMLFDQAVMARALLDFHLVTREETYLRAGLRATNYLVSQQRGDGSLPVSLTKRTIDTHFHTGKAAIVLLLAYHITGSEDYARSSSRLLDFVVDNFQKQDGNFRLEHESKEWNRAHYMCYAVEGLLASSCLIREHTANFEAAVKYLSLYQNQDGSLCYNYDMNGNAVRSGVDLAATAQAARIFHYADVAMQLEYSQNWHKALEYLLARQRKSRWKHHDGGLPFGYHRIADSIGACCTWAGEFAIDAYIRIHFMKSDISADLPI
jgi:uncharacterized protein YyaL (SSP411 family)